MKWVRERIGNGGEEPLSRHGFNSISLDLLENWLHCNINVFSQRCHPAKRICMSTCSVSNHTIGGQQRIARTFNTERSSDGKFVDTVNLLSETNHVYGIVNLSSSSRPDSVLSLLLNPISLLITQLRLRLNPSTFIAPYQLTYHLSMCLRLFFLNWGRSMILAPCIPHVTSNLAPLA